MTALKKLRSLREARRLTQLQAANRIGVSKAIDVSGLDENSIVLVSTLIENLRK